MSRDYGFPGDTAMSGATTNDADTGASNDANKGASSQSGERDQSTKSAATVARAAVPFGARSDCLVESPITLNNHYGPSTGVPYESNYTGNRASKNIVIDPTKLYAAAVSGTGNNLRPVAPVDTTNGSLLLSSTPAAIGNMTGTNYWGPNDSEATTLAMDGGGDLVSPSRIGKSYAWYWGLGTTAAAYLSPNPGASVLANSVSVAEVLNNSDGSLITNTKPSRIFFIPLSTAAAYRYWSGGEVDQRTGRIYFSSGEDAAIGSTFRLMIFDPLTGNYAESGNLVPKTAADGTRFNGIMPASDMAIDGNGDMYIIASAVSTSNPGTGINQATAWIVKVEYRPSGGWVYSGVVPLWNKVGTNYNPIGGTNIWGMAFHEGRLYLSGADVPGGGTGRGSLYAADPLTGWADRVPGGNAGGEIYDLASAQLATVLNGVVYNDANRNGVQDTGEVGVANQTIQLYDNTGVVRGEQTTNAAGEYSFLVPPPSGSANSYRVRLVQPQITVAGGVANAAQTGITHSTLCGLNTVQVQSYGQDVAESTSPTQLASGSYIDYPKQTLGATDGTESLSASQMLLSAEYTVESGNDVTTVNFGINATGSWGDAGSNLTSFNTRAAQNGPRHINPVHDGVEPRVYLGDNPGWYQDGSINNEHASTDDGVRLVRQGAYVDPEQWVFAAGNSYTFEATVNGNRAGDSTVRAWLSTRNAGTFPNTLPVSRSGSGEFTVAVPATPTVTTFPHFLRVNATSTNNIIGTASYNSLPTGAGPYAPAKGSVQSRTTDWVIDGETEDYRLLLANAALHLSVEGAPGSYGFALTNVLNAPPSLTTATGVVPSDGSAVLVSSHVIVNPAAATTITLTMPPGVRVVGTVDLLDLNGTVVGTATYNQVTEQLTIPASLWSINNDLTLRLRTEPLLTLEATKLLATINHGTTSTSVTASDFEIIAVDTASNELVLNAGGAVQLDRGEVYTISERVASGAPTEAGLFVRAGLACTDGNGDPLPAGVFDAATSTITPDVLTEAIECTVTNQAAEVTLVPVRVGAAGPGTGWQLDLTASNPTYDTSLTEGTATKRIRPGDFAAAATLIPTGTSLIAIERLDLDDSTCAAYAANLTNVPSNCWIALTAAELANLEITPGTHEALRVVVTSAEDMPNLPFTGGLAGWVFTLIGGGGLTLAAAFYIYQRRQTAKVGIHS